ncbi:MAG: hypothetical protein ACI4DS_04065 [Eubacterium sp.]
MLTQLLASEVSQATLCYASGRFREVINKNMNCINYINEYYLKEKCDEII